MYSVEMENISSNRRPSSLHMQCSFVQNKECKVKIQEFGYKVKKLKESNLSVKIKVGLHFILSCRCYSVILSTE